MPILESVAHDEKSMLLAELRDAAQNARDLAFGLDIDALGARPVASSELTLGWLVLHMADVIAEWGLRARSGARDPWEDASPAERFSATNVDLDVDGAGSAEEILERVDAGVARGIEAFAEADLDARIATPFAPWFPPDSAPLTARWAGRHALVEVHRHSGQGDILREALDGRQMYELRAEAEGTSLAYIDEWFAAHAAELQG